MVVGERCGSWEGGEYKTIIFLRSEYETII